jgi:hypothetical protein
MASLNNVQEIQRPGDISQLQDKKVKMQTIVNILCKGCPISAYHNGDRVHSLNLYDFR